MKLAKGMMAVAVVALFSPLASAQTAESEVQRNIVQQERIEQGLRSGELTAREGAKLEHEAGRVERMQANALKDGRLTPAETGRIERAQDRLGRDIYRESHDAQRGDPGSSSSRHMQAQVGRNIEQQRGIEQGMRSGRLDPRQTAYLERRESHQNRMQGREHGGGYAGHGEARHTQYGGGHQSQHVQHGDEGRHVHHANYGQRRR